MKKKERNNIMVKKTNYIHMWQQIIYPSLPKKKENKQTNIIFQTYVIKLYLGMYCTSACICMHCITWKKLVINPSCLLWKFTDILRKDRNKDIPILSYRKDFCCFQGTSDNLNLVVSFSDWFSSLMECLAKLGDYPTIPEKGRFSNNTRCEDS